MDLQPDEMPIPPILEVEEDEEDVMQDDGKDEVNIAETTDGNNILPAQAVEEDGN